MEASNNYQVLGDIEKLMEGYTRSNAASLASNMIANFKSNEITNFVGNMQNSSGEEKLIFLKRNPIELATYMFNTGRLNASIYQSYKSLFEETQRDIEHNRQSNIADTRFFQMPKNPTDEDIATAISDLTGTVSQDIIFQSFERITGRSSAWWRTAMNNSMTTSRNLSSDADRLLNLPSRNDSEFINSINEVIDAIDKHIAVISKKRASDVLNSDWSILKNYESPKRVKAFSFFHSPNAIIPLSVREELIQKKNLLIAKKNSVR
ncbi:MAG: hypothetical protein ACRCX2_04880 [Paraclostridium sp.]